MGLGSLLNSVLVRKIFIWLTCARLVSVALCSGLPFGLLICVWLVKAYVGHICCSLYLMASHSTAEDGPSHWQNCRHSCCSSLLSPLLQWLAPFPPVDCYTGNFAGISTTDMGPAYRYAATPPIMLLACNICSMPQQIKTSFNRFCK